MITKAIVTYSDGTEATFTAESLDLSTIPTVSPEQQAAATTQVSSPVTPTE